MSNWAVVTVTETVTRTFMLQNTSDRARTKKLALEANEEEGKSVVPEGYQPGFAYTLLESKTELNAHIVSTNLDKEEY